MLSAGAVALMLAPPGAEASVPVSLASAASRLAGSPAQNTGAAAVLARSVLRGMALARLKGVLLVAGGGGAAGGGGRGAGGRARGAAPANTPRLPPAPAPPA